MAGMICDVCGGRIVATGYANQFVCGNCGTEYLLVRMDARYPIQEDRRAQGLCKYCGGKLGWFSTRCRDCGMQN